MAIHTRADSRSRPINSSQALTVQTELRISLCMFELYNEEVIETKFATLREKLSEISFS